MTRLCLTAEGQTEQQFATQVLAPHLAGHGVYLAKPRLALTSRKRGQRGGVLSYEVVRNDIQHWLKQEKGDHVCFTMMFDLYGLPHSFPDYRQAVAMRNKYGCVEALEMAIRKDLQDARFVPYLQLHEFETILFSDPRAFTRYYPGCDRQAEALCRVADQFGNPELIDDGEQTAPSKRIIEQFPDYEGYKPTAGPIIAEAIGLEVIRSRCRHFNEWLTKLEELGCRA